MGRFESGKGKRAIIVCAPHGFYELMTEGIVKELASSLSASYVVASGFRKRSHPINVNRPTEGIGLSSKEEPSTDRSRHVFKQYIQMLRAIQDGNGVSLLVEIHGNSIKDLSHIIEIATKGFHQEFLMGLKRTQNERLKNLFPTDPYYRFMIEPLDPIVMAASGAKRTGSLREFQRALHIELPRELRVNDAYRERTVRLLSAMLDEIDLHLQEN